jgi:DNA polymerase/3'-5' exonuclease PolX
MATKQETFEWRVAFSAANEIRSKLESHCERILVVGSLRRQCPTVHDIDIVLVPKAGEIDLFQFQLWLHDVLGSDWQMIKGKAKLIHGTYAGIPVDLYFATPDTWWTLVVIRTGSAQHNIKLCSRAKAMGMKLHADGSGIEDFGYATGPGAYQATRLLPTSEEDVFAKLRLDYVEPKDRR